MINKAKLFFLTFFLIASFSFIKNSNSQNQAKDSQNQYSNFQIDQENIQNIHQQNQTFPQYSNLSEYWQIAPQKDIYNQEQKFNIISQDSISDIRLKQNLAVFKEKKPTPARFFVADISIPDKFNTTNNLAKKVGSFFRAYGEIIFIKGTISDSFGVPIEGAIVEIWQANAAGKYHTLLDQDSEFVDQYFNMSGRAISDNLGNYDFITIMPGANLGRAPHINFNIYHPRFGKIETEMYFEDHPYNSSDYQYLAYEDEDRKMLTAKVRRTDFYDRNSIKICTFDIVMRGIHRFKKY
jgi:protocatechuate 3,4-dioxygenase beta subunit